MTQTDTEKSRSTMFWNIVQKASWVLAICGVLFVFYKGCLERKDKILNADERSELKVDSIYLGGSKIFVDSLNPGFIHYTGVRFWIRLTNISTQTCKLVFFASIDSFTNAKILRSHILAGDTMNTEVRISPDFPDYTFRPNESKVIRVVALGDDESRDTTYLHTMFIYTNSFGGIFENYVIQKMVHTVKIDKPLDFGVDTLKKRLTFMIPNKIVKLEKGEFKDHYHIYNDDEVKSIQDYFDKIDKTLKIED